MRISYKISILIILFTISSVSAQEKLKGNKIVVTEDRNISDFTKIEVIDDVNVFLVFNDKQSVAVEADSNLQSAILTEVRDGTLTIRTSEVIGRSKVLNIHLKVNRKLHDINTYNNAKVSSKNSINVEYLIMNAYDDSEFDLKLNSKSAHVNGKKDTKLNFEILSDDVVIQVEESSSFKGTIDTKDINITCLDKGTVTVNGTADYLEIEASGDSSYKGEEFVINTTILKAYNDATLYIHITELLELFSNNSSEIYLYGNPEILIHEFFDKAIIRKKEVD